MQLLSEALADGDAHTWDIHEKRAALKPMRELWEIDVATGALQLRHQVLYPAGTL